MKIVRNNASEFVRLEVLDRPLKEVEALKKERRSKKIQETKRRKATIAQLATELEMKQNELQELKFKISSHEFDLQMKQWKEMNQQLIRMKEENKITTTVPTKSISDIMCEYCWETQMLMFKFDFIQYSSSGSVVV